MGPDDHWYRSDDISGTKPIAKLPRAGIWEEKNGEMPSMYFYARTDLFNRQAKSPKGKSPKAKTPKGKTPESVEPERIRFVGKGFTATIINRPDGGMLIGANFDDLDTVKKVREQIRKLIGSDPSFAETKMEHLKYVWRMGHRKNMKSISKILNGTKINF